MSAPGWARIPWRALALAGAAGLVLAAGWLAWRLDVPVPPLDGAGKDSVMVVDRAGRLLRPFTAPDGRWRLPARAEDVDPRFLAFLKAYEDSRFEQHPGVDPVALGRAALQAARYGKVVSGGSTLTMQVVRRLTGDGRRSLSRKLDEMGAALALERALGKARVLELYLALAPYGGNLEGVRAASLAYFGKEPARLSVAEAALLVALPQAPEQRRPDRDAQAARRARDRVLDRLVAAGALADDEAQAAKEEPVPTGRAAVPILAAHAAEAARARHADQPVIRLTIDRTMQAALEALAKDQARRLGPQHSVAILVVEHATGAVRAHVGSADYLDTTRAGAVDQARAVRSPGSALKPFVFGLAFEDGVLHPDTVMEDRPTRFGVYAPKNFDQGFQGTVTARQALQMSLNIPAVAALEAVGPHRLAARLRFAGANLELPIGETPGLAIGLGGVGVRLTDLATLYVALARGGGAVPLTDEPAAAASAAEPGKRLIDRVAAWQTANALLGTAPPTNFTPGRIAFKTGTSYGYRDAWSVGFDGRHVVAVWAGRPDGAASAGLIGRDSAAPVLFEAFARIAPRPEPLPAPPAGALVDFARLPPALKRFQPVGGSAPPAIERTEMPLVIAFPPDGARVDLAGGGRGREPLALKAAGGTPPFTWMIDGRPLGEAGLRRESFWMPPSPGFARVTVVDGEGRTASAAVRID